MIFHVEVNKVPVDRIFQKLCKTPYKNNPGGCPNFCKKAGCPPRKLFNDFFDMDQSMFVIATPFKVGEFAEGKGLKYPDKTGKYPDSPLNARDMVWQAIKRLRAKHPDWPDGYFPDTDLGTWESSRLWYSIRWWQPRARKQHQRELKLFEQEHPDHYIERRPEALGVNITGLMYELGIKLNWQWPPPHDVKNITYRVSMAGRVKF